MTTAIEQTLETYGIENWGAGYFDVNRKETLSSVPPKVTLAPPTSKKLLMTWPDVELAHLCSCASRN